MPIIRIQGTMTCDPADLPEVESVFQTFIANVRANEPGVVTYHYFVDDGDPLVIHVIEEYESPDVMVDHYTNLDGAAVGRLLELVELGPPHYFGEPTAKEREILAGFGTVHYHRPLTSIEAAPSPAPN
jgi:quinol monooxygenase YgiN